MNEVTTHSGISLRLEMACSAAAVREAARLIRDYLQNQGVAAADVDAWELCLVEAGNNAQAYAPESARHLPIAIEILLETRKIEARIYDHTNGFDLPERAVLPPEDSEHGRGLFLMQQITDRMQYLRGRDGNCLVLQRARAEAGNLGAAVAQAELQARLAESERVLEAMTEELGASYESLSAIFRFIAELSQAHHLGGFASKRLIELLAVIEADWYVFRIVDADQREAQVFAASREGWQAPPLVLGGAEPAGAEVRALRTRADVWFDGSSPLATDDPLAQPHGDALCGLSHPVFVGEQAVGVLTAARNRPDAPFTAGQVNVIQTFADFLGLHIANVRLQEASVQSRLVTRELEIAAEIQRSLLPEELIQPPGFRLAGGCQPARQVGGDFYDAIADGRNGLLLAIADVMGKGVPAAMFAAIFRSQVRARLDLATRPSHFLSWLNETLFPDLHRVDMFITAQLAYVNLETRTMHMASAGHPPLLVADAAGEVREVGPQGLPLGIVQRHAYDEASISLGPGASVFLFTDGLTEARSPSGEFFGLEELKQWLADTQRRHLSVPQGCADLHARLHRFQDTAIPADDQTYLWLSEEPANGAAATTPRNLRRPA
jgi:serine phosphatase RsbU (regulator of sigma subunit)/anti-sigma regulatory factor (Ser/Thr protein kinase)